MTTKSEAYELADKPKKVEAKEETKVAIVYAGHGQTWCVGTEANIILATRAVRKAKRDWGKMYKIPKEHIFNVYLYDLTDVKDLWGFEYDTGRVYDDETKETCPFIEKLQVVV
tara:strand:- start:125 stop:463 length:339 start_codon:yes stop_codon:yes gene_type:complete